MEKGKIEGTSSVKDQKRIREDLDLIDKYNAFPGSLKKENIVKLSNGKYSLMGVEVILKSVGEISEKKRECDRILFRINS